MRFSGSATSRTSGSSPGSTCYDPHAPYDPPEPYKSRYAGRPYDGEIAWTDSLVGRLVDELTRLDLTKKTVVAVHRGSRREPGRARRARARLLRLRAGDARPVRLDDALLGNARPGRRRGRAFGRRRADGARSPRLRGDAPRRGAEPRSRCSRAHGSAPGDGYSESYYARFHYGWSELRAVRTKRWHFIESPRGGALRPRGRSRRNDEPGVARALDGRAVAVVAFGVRAGSRSPSSPRPRPSKRTKRRFASWRRSGYIGGTAVADGTSWRDLARSEGPPPHLRPHGPHPRDGQGGKEDDAIALLESVLEEAPEVIDAYYTLGNCYLKKKAFAQGGRVLPRDARQAPRSRLRHDRARRHARRGRDASTRRSPGTSTS